MCCERHLRQKRNTVNTVTNIKLVHCENKNVLITLVELIIANNKNSANHYIHRRVTNQVLCVFAELRTATIKFRRVCPSVRMEKLNLLVHYVRLLQIYELPAM